MDANEVLAVLPDIFGRHERFPSDLIGATIVRFGTVAQSKIGGGGLVIDYLPQGAEEPKRVVFGFSEIGMWVESQVGSI